MLDEALQNMIKDAVLSGLKEAEKLASDPPHINWNLLEDYRPGWNKRTIQGLEQKYGKLPFVIREGKNVHIDLKGLDRWLLNEEWILAEREKSPRHQKSRYRLEKIKG